MPQVLAWRLAGLFSRVIVRTVGAEIPPSRARRDHYLPAALIGGFGLPSERSSRSRDAMVAVRYRDQTEAVLQTAKTVATQLGVYQLTAPPPGLSSDAIDDLWQEYEPKLHYAIDHFGHASWDDEDWAVVLAHITALAVRHPDFAHTATRFRADRGDPIGHPDEIQAERVRTLRNTPALLATSRCALIRTGEASSRLVINDKGFTTVEDAQVAPRGIFFPLSPSMGILVVPGIGPHPEHERAWIACQGEWTAGAVDMMNHASWRQTRIRCVIGYPTQVELLASLNDETPLVAPELGPYRRRGIEGMFDWAYRVS